MFRQPSNKLNGSTVDGQGRLVTCEHLTGQITRTEHDGSISVLSASFKGKRFNSLNDIVVKSDGSIWFSDPPYGILFDYEGGIAESEIGACNVYRIDPQSGDFEIAADDFDKPNGPAFSPEEKYLYAADTDITHNVNGPKHIRRFEINADGKSLRKSMVFADCTAGPFDGFRLDSDGRIWMSAADGVHCYDPDGTLIGKVLVPELVSNLCFGGAKRNRLFICGSTSLYSIFLAING